MCRMSIKVLKSTIQEKLDVLIVFHDIIADMISNKKLNPVVFQLFIRGRKLNDSLVCNTESYFQYQKIVTISSSHYFNMKM